jgi:antagonist of KipI
MAQIVSADLPAVGQLMPGEKLRFSAVTRKEAEDLLIEKEQMMTELQIGIALEYRKT